MHETNWAQPNPSALQDPSGPRVPDTEPLATEYLPEIEVVLSELGACYPVVAYPATQISVDGEDDMDRTIYAGLVNS